MYFQAINEDPGPALKGFALARELANVQQIASGMQSAVDAFPDLRSRPRVDRSPERFAGPKLIQDYREGIKQVEICRSFSYKMNLKHYGGKDYESVDLFASRKLTCAVDEQQWVSQQIFEECVAEVRAAVLGVADSIRKKAIQQAQRADELNRQRLRPRVVNGAPDAFVEEDFEGGF